MSVRLSDAIETSSTDIRVKSGYVYGYQAIRDTIIAAAHNAVLIGGIQAWRQYQGIVAEKTGAMRKALKDSLYEVINAQRGNTTIRIDFNEVVSRATAKVPYTEHHSEVGPTGLSYYKNPTTPGTRPFRAQYYMSIALPLIRSKFKQNMQTLGIKVL